jgi:hypothetical protein
MLSRQLGMIPSLFSSVPAPIASAMQSTLKAHFFIAIAVPIIEAIEKVDCK